MWLIRTDIGGFGGRVPEGIEPVVQSYATQEEAQAQVEFSLASPAFLPEGYALREILVPPVRDATTVLLYAGPGGDIVLAETPVGRQAGATSASRATMSVKSAATITNGAIEPTDLDGRPAAWIDGRSLVWEAGGMAYQLGGLDLTLEQAREVARSLVRGG
jgi:hypothetical protein